MTQKYRYQTPQWKLKIQKDFDKLEQQVESSKMNFNRGKQKILCLKKKKSKDKNGMDWQRPYQAAFTVCRKGSWCPGGSQAEHEPIE